MAEKVNEGFTPTEVEHVNVIIPEETRKPEKATKEDRQPCCVKVLTVLVILLLMTIAALIVVYFVVLKDDDDDDDKIVDAGADKNQVTNGTVVDAGADKNQVTNGTDGGTNNNGVTNRTAEEGICTTRNCIINAGVIARMMDPSVDPCQNFADFACGGFYQETEEPENGKRAGAFVSASDDNYDLARDIIEEKTSPDDPEYLVKMKDCYWSCMNEETVGIEHFLNTSFPSMWPTLNPTWDPATFDFNKTMAEYALHDITPFMSVKVDPNLFNSSKYAIYFRLPTRFPISTAHLSGPRNGSGLLAFHKYLTAMAVEVGADPEVASDDADQYIDFLIRVAMASLESDTSSYLIYVSTLASWFPEFDFLSALQAKFNKTGIQLDIQQDLIISGYGFYRALVNIISETDPRVLQNTFALAHAGIYLGELTQNLRDAKYELDRETIGLTVKQPTWKHCLGQIAYYLWQGLGKEFVKRKLLLSNESQILDYMNEIVDSVKSEFSDILDHADWMANTTKLAAHEKLAKMGRKIAYPHDNFRESDINSLYQNISFAKNNYFENRQIFRRFYFTSVLKKLGEKVDNTRWETRLVDPGAFYSGVKNQMIIPIGIMTPIFYSDNYPDSLNYGGIATTVGHEIIHGFDSFGSLFDGDGSYNNWWQAEDRAEFDNRIQCVIDHFNTFVHPQVNLSLNGERNVGEAVADQAGAKIAFRAYKKRYNQSSPKERPLPGLGMTVDQQYYITFAQRFCQVHTDEWLTDHILNIHHPPGRFRIIGSLQHDRDFAEVFNCAPGSYMNPTDKCVVW